MNGKKKWYALHLRANQEKTTATFLTDRSVDYFFPTYRVRSTRTDRRVTVEKPLFPGYVFVHLDYASKERVEALKAPGAVRIVGFGNQPGAIPAEVIDSLRILVGGNEDVVRPHPLVRVGNRVRVTDGPFTGAVGILSETTGRNSKLIVEIELLGRAVSVTIEKEQVAPQFD